MIVILFYIHPDDTFTAWFITSRFENVLLNHT
jgi:hypothetical protein